MQGHQSRYIYLAILHSWSIHHTYRKQWIDGSISVCRVTLALSRRVDPANPGALMRHLPRCAALICVSTARTVRLRGDRYFEHIPDPWGSLGLCAVRDRSGTAGQPFEGKQTQVLHVPEQLSLGPCAQVLQDLPSNPFAMHSKQDASTSCHITGDVSCVHPVRTPVGA